MSRIAVRPATAPASALALACALAWALGAAGPVASEPAELAELFPREADVLGASGLTRLPLPPEVLAACRPDLSDLRLFEASGREIPYLVDAGPASRNAAESIVRTVVPRTLEARREEVRSEERPALRRETFDLAVDDAEELADGAELVLDVARAEFVARVRVERLDPATGEIAPLAEGSLFRLGGAARAEKLRLPLPPIGGARLRVTLETEGESWLEPGFRLVARRDLRTGERVAVPLDVLWIRTEGGRTEIELARPVGLVPDRLRLETATGSFDRVVEVRDEGPRAGAELLGRGRLFRLDLDPPVGEDEIEVAPARGARLRLAIEDGDSPPLAGMRVLAVARQPVLIFGAGRPEGAVLRFGGGRAHAPRYDLAHLLPAPGAALEPARAQAVAGLFAPDALTTARLGPARDNPRYDGAPALAFAMRPGAEAEVERYARRRALQVPQSAEGLSSWTLQPADLAALGPGLGDLRVVDDAGRQWPYLLERDAAEARVPLEVARVESADGTTTWELRPADAPLPIESLVLDIDAGYFDREYALSGRLDGEPAGLRGDRSGRLRRDVGDRSAPEIAVEGRVDRVVLEVRDGDDAPLPLGAASARLRLPRLYLTAPPGAYALLVGAPQESAPTYDLERVRDVVLAVRAAEIEAGPLEPNPDLGAAARWRGRLGGGPLLVWGVLLLAVVVLTFLTLRLARKT